MTWIDTIIYIDHIKLFILTHATGCYKAISSISTMDLLEELRVEFDGTQIFLGTALPIQRSLS